MTLLPTLVLSLLVPSAGAAAFPDVLDAHLHAQAIAYVRDKGMVTGYPDGTFRPETPLIRAEFTKLVLEAAHPGAARGDGCFPDVRGQWYGPYVCYAKERGIVGGYPDGTFRPTDGVTFAEAAKILAETFDLPTDDHPTDEDWFTKYGRALEHRGAIPTDIGAFGSKLTRGQMAELLWRLHAGIESEPSHTVADIIGIASPRTRRVPKRARASSSSARSATRAASSSRSAAAADGRNALPYELAITADWKTAWTFDTDVEGSKESMANAEMREEPQGEFPRFLRVSFPKGSANRFVWKFYGKPLGGLIAWVDPRIQPRDELYFRYRVRLPKDFVYGRSGGNLPAIFTGMANKRDEQSTATLGFAWDKDGLLTVRGTFRKDEISYAMPTMAKLPADGQWHELTLRGRLSPQVHKENGSFDAWMDGEKIAHLEHVRFENRTDDRWDAVSLAASYHGEDAINVVPSDQYLDLAGFELSDKPFKD